MKTKRSARIAKSHHKHALITLATVAELGEASAEQVFKKLQAEGRRNSIHTDVRMWDLQAMGCLTGHGQHPDYAKGVSHTYTVTDLGRALLAWR